MALDFFLRLRQHPAQGAGSSQPGSGVNTPFHETTREPALQETTREPAYPSALQEMTNEPVQDYTSMAVQQAVGELEGKGVGGGVGVEDY